MGYLMPGAFLRQGRYQIVKILGKGGMGAVYCAEDQELRCNVAIKQRLTEGETDDHEETLRRQFQREAQILANLTHPGLPRVMDHFIEADGSQFLVMDYIDGKPLSLSTPDIPLDRVLWWAAQLLEILAYLEQQHVVHRDIKPANIKLIDQDRIILLDFGIAVSAQAHLKATMTSLPAGTPSYASPEQMLPMGPITTASDVYALGGTLYHLLSTEAPLADAATRKKALEAGREDPLPPLSQRASHMPSRVSAWVMQMLEIDPRQRPAVATLKEELISIRAALQRPRRRSAIKVGVTLGVLAVAALIIFFMTQGTPVQSHASVPSPTIMATMEALPAISPSATTHVATGAVLLTESTSTPNTIPTPTEAPLTQEERDRWIREASAWPVVISDTFATNQNQWYEDHVSDFQQTVADGVYTLKLHSENPGGVIGWTDKKTPVLGDFYIKVAFKQLDGDTDARAGIMFRKDQQKQRYTVQLMDDQSLFLSKFLRSGSARILDTKSAEILAFKSNWNVLEVIGKGPRFVIYINGHYAAEKVDPDISTGQVDILMYVSKKNDASFMFDNFEVRAPTILPPAPLSVAASALSGCWSNQASPLGTAGINVRIDEAGVPWVSQTTACGKNTAEEIMGVFDANDYIRVIIAEHPWTISRRPDGTLKILIANFHGADELTFYKQ